jgi:hypothetical protein
MTKYSFLHDFWVSRRFSVWRHVLLVLSLAFIAFHLTNVLPYRIYLWAASLTVIYFNIYVLVPRLLLKKRYALYGLALSASVILMLTAKEMIRQTVSSPSDIPQTYGYVNLLDSVSYFVIYIICLSGVSIIRLILLWTDDRMQISRLESEHARSETDRMKEQIHPQFLFNILSRTSELALTDARKTSDMLFRLSQLLRYELYDCNRDEVLLSSDIQFVAGYLELEHLYADDFEYTLSVTGNANNRFVPPLLFIPFVQNVLNQIRCSGQSSVLQVSFQADDAEIRFACSADGVNLSDSYFSKVRRRLELLYPGKYALSATKGCVELKLCRTQEAESRKPYGTHLLLSAFLLSPFNLFLLC